VRSTSESAAITPSFETVSNRAVTHPSVPSSRLTKYQVFASFEYSTFSEVPAFTLCTIGKLLPCPERKLALPDELLVLITPRIDGVAVGIGVGETVGAGGTSVGRPVGEGMGVSDGGRVAVYFGVVLMIGARV